MSNFLFIRSKTSLNRKTLLKTNENLNSKYLKKKKKIIFIKSKNYDYHFVLNRDASEDILRQKKGIVILFVGNVYNLNISKKKKISKIQLILDGYLKQGISFIKKLDGNFSILILNLKNDKILSFRDRHGSNVLFYYNKKDLLLIFTKIKFLKKNFLIKMEPNWELIKTYIFKNYRYSYGTIETFFKDVFLFKNNSINLFIKRKLITSNLYTFKIKNSDYKNVDKIKKKFLALLNASFNKRYSDLKNDKAFLLSGGLDSPTIAAIGSKNIKSPIKTYSIGYKKLRQNKKELFYDESLLIKKIVKFNKFKSKFVYPNAKNFKRVFGHMLNIHDEPISSPTWYSHYILCKRLYDDKVKCVFGGDGGDHILAGLYDDIPYFLADLKFSKKQRLFNHELKKWIQMHDHPIYKKNKKVFKTYLNKCFDPKRKGKILNYTWDEDLMRGNNQYLNLLKKGIKIKNNNKFPSITKSFLKSKLIQDLHFTSSPPSTRAEIPNFSEFGIECRSVFLDENVVKFCWNLPITLMIKDGYTKWLIRHSLKDYLPLEILWNKKHVGLNAPANIWFRKDLKKDLQQTINNIVKRKNFSIFDINKLQNVLQEHFLGKKNHMMFLWKLYSLEKWLKNWNFK